MTSGTQATSAAPALASPGDALLRDSGRSRWLSLLAGGAGVVIGVVALFYPGPTLLAVGLLFGIYLLIWGATMAARAATGSFDSAPWRTTLIILGIGAALAGLLLMVRPGQSVLFVVWVSGFWLTLTGGMQLVAGLAIDESPRWVIAMGIVNLIAGIIILASPGLGLVALVWIVAVDIIVHGALEIGAALSGPKADSLRTAEVAA